MDFNSIIVLLDSFEVFTRVKVCISLRHFLEFSPFTPCQGWWHEWNVGTYCFLVPLGPNAPRLLTLCAFESPRFEKLVFLSRLGRDRATRLGFLMTVGSHG
jgi:hypothetical protein